MRACWVCTHATWVPECVHHKDGIGARRSGQVGQCDGADGAAQLELTIVICNKSKQLILIFELIRTCWDLLRHVDLWALVSTGIIGTCKKVDLAF